MADFTADEWIKGEQPLAGKIALVMKNVSLANVRRRDYPYELIVHLVYEEIQEDGLPGSVEEIELLDRNEKVIASHFCSRHDARFALCVTSEGIRDQFLYLPRHISDEELASELDALSLSVDYDFGIRKCPDWEIYECALPENRCNAQSSKLPWWRTLFGLR
jgi:hypothetical protein